MCRLEVLLLQQLKSSKKKTDELFEQEKEQFGRTEEKVDFMVPNLYALDKRHGSTDTEISTWR